MNFKQNRIFYFNLVVLFFISMSCKTSQVNDSDFITSVTLQHWVAGIEEGGSGTNITFNLSDNFPKSLELLEVQYKASKVKPQKISDSQYIAYFKKPIAELKSTKKLKPNQVILFYKINGKNKSLIKTAKELPFLAFPSTRPKDER